MTPKSEKWPELPFSHRENFGFYSKCDEKPLEGFQYGNAGWDLKQPHMRLWRGKTRRAGMEEGHRILSQNHKRWWRHWQLCWREGGKTLWKSRFRDGLGVGQKRKGVKLIPGVWPKQCREPWTIPWDEKQWRRFWTSLEKNIRHPNKNIEKAVGYRSLSVGGLGQESLTLVCVLRIPLSVQWSLWSSNAMVASRYSIRQTVSEVTKQKASQTRLRCLNYTDY